MILHELVTSSILPSWKSLTTRSAASTESLAATGISIFREGGVKNYKTLRQVQGTWRCYVLFLMVGGHNQRTVF